MSRKRSISTTISHDKRINALAREAGDFACLLYTWMIPHAEDSASMTGDPEELLCIVMPGRRDRSEQDVAAALAAMDRLELIAWDGQTVWFDSESFYRHQSYINQAKRADNAEHFHERRAARLTSAAGSPAAETRADHRRSPQNAVEDRESPQNAVSLSPSPSPSPSLTPSVGAEAPTGAGGTVITGSFQWDEDFEAWWGAYGRVGVKAQTRDLYRWWRRQGTTSDELLAAAVNYRRHCEATDCKMKHGSTFLAKRSKDRSAVWPEWASGEEHGSMDTRRASRLNDVLAVAADVFGLGAESDQQTDQDCIDVGPASAAAGGPLPRRGLPPPVVAR